MKVLTIFAFTFAFVANSAYGSVFPEPSRFCELYASKPKCDPNAKYRTLNGVCNNLQNPKWGAEFNVLQRVTNARFKDGVSEIVESVKGGPLPTARKVSLFLFRNANASSSIFSLALPQFGQLLAEDEGFSADTILPKACCNPDFTLAPEPRDPMCFYIPIDSTDPTYAQAPRQCMNVLRSATDISSKCPGFNKAGPASVVNAVTAYMDLSSIYGSDDEENKILRLFKNGLLHTKNYKGSEYPQYMPKDKSLCPEDNETGKCFMSGDFRMNGYPALASLNIMFVREHNRLARELKQINPHWCDEKLFQEARRINIAEFQYITHYHYFAELLGKWFMRKNLLIFHDSGYERVDDYDPNVNINLITEHATAAHRYFHTMVKSILNMVSKHNKLVGTLPLKDTYFRPSVLQTGNYMDDVARGMCRQATGALDRNIEDGIKEFLFRGGNNLFGNDLKAIDIQRGRDHGLGSYNDAREYCGLPRAKTWTGFADEIRQEDIDRLKVLYKDPDDVELSAGGALERIVADAACGRTFQCLMAAQVLNSRIGDRFWFETNNPVVKFTKTQLNQIRKASLSRIFCDNGKSITTMQRNAFRIPSDENPIVGCNMIPKINLYAWKEDPSSSEEN